MTNYEWIVTNEKEIIEDIFINYLGKQKGKVRSCDEIGCRNCEFAGSANSNQSCFKATKEWLKAEHEPLYKKGDVVIDKEGKLWVIDSVCDDTVGVYIKTIFSMSMSAIKIKDIAKKVGNIYDE